MLLCNRVGHIQGNIKDICTRKECQENSACCGQCMKEFHSDHKISEFQDLDQFLQNNWISPKINNLLKILEETQALIALYHQTIKEMLSKSDFYLNYQKQPGLTLLNHLGLMNKYRPSVEQNIGKLENQFQSFKFQIEDQYYKVVKQLTKSMLTNTISLNEIQPLNIQGHLLFIKGNWKGALHHYEQQKMKDSTRQKINQAWCLHQIGNRQKAIEILNQLYSKHPQIKKILFKKYILEINSKQNRETQNLIRDQIMKNKELSCLTFKMGLIEAEAKKYAEALKYYNQGIEQCSQNHKIYIQKAECLSSMGRKDEAIKSIDQGISVNAWDSQLYIEKAEYLYRMGRKDEAIKSIDQGLRINPWDSQLYIKKAKCLSRIGRKDEAIKSIEQGTLRKVLIHMKCSELFIVGQVNLSIYLMDMDDEAIMSVDQGININSLDSQLYIKKAKFLSSMGRKDEAIKSIDLGISINSWDSCLYSQKAEYLSWMGREDDANQVQQILKQLQKNI